MRGRKACSDADRDEETTRLFRLVMEAVRYFDRAEGATPTDVRAYIRTYHRAGVTDQELAVFVKDALKIALSIGVLKTYNRKYVLINHPKFNSQKKVNQVVLQRAGWAGGERKPVVGKLLVKRASRSDICKPARGTPRPKAVSQGAKAKKATKIPALRKKQSASRLPLDARPSSPVSGILNGFGQPRVVNICVRSRKPSKYGELRPKKPYLRPKKPDLRPKKPKTKMC